MNDYESIVALENEAIMAQAQQRYEEAFAAHGRALLIARRLDRPRLTAVLFNRVGQAQEAFGDVQKAVTAYEAGLRALAEDSDFELEDVMLSLMTVSKGYFDVLGDFEVPDLFSQAVATDLAAAEEDVTLPVKLLINIGNAYLRQPQDMPALNAYEKALARSEIQHAPELRAHALTHIGIVQRRRGNVDEAEAALTDALNLLDKHADRLEERRVLAALAGIYRDRGDIDQALQSYQQALELYEQADDALGKGRALAGLGRLYLEQGQMSEAQAAFERAAAALPDGADDTRWYVLWGLGYCQRAAGDLEGAALNLRNSLNLIRWRQRELRTDEGKVTFIESVRDVYDQLIAVHLERARTEPARYQAAMEVAEEARGQAFRDLLDSRRQRRLSEHGIRASRQRPFGERQNMASQMAPGISVDFDSPAQMAPGISVGFDSPVQMAPGIETGPPPNLEALLNEAAHIIHARQDEKWPMLTEMAAAIPSGDVGEQLTEEEAARVVPPVARLIFHVMDDRTAVFAVSPDGNLRSHVFELGQDAITQRVQELRDMLRVDNAPRGVRLTRDAHRATDSGALADPKQLLRDLYADLVAPVADGLPTDGTPVVIEPHGALWLLPFAALLGPDDVWLADQWPLLYAPSTQVFDDIRHEPDYGSPANLKALVVGNPTMPTVSGLGDVEVELEPLPGAEQEARVIAGLLPEPRRTLLLGEHADRETVEALMQTHGILHLATHGIAYADDPLQSFIALADSEAVSGVLTASDVSDLWLPADIIALSACQTGLGKVSGDGMIGLARAFLTAGARSVLVSLWSVSDEATAALMASFYQGYIELDDKAIALQRAMRELRAHPDYAHPRYWAPFVVVGAEA
jgi:CHAT domain-containing protein/tetratricopeptide (TPR) repeat protein